MSRWSYGDWVLCAVAIDESGDVIPLSEVNRRGGLNINGYYSEEYWLRTEYYKMSDFTGEVYSKYEGFFTVNANLKIEDNRGGVNIIHKECEGYTCCGEDCYMLLIVSLGDDAESTTVEFQKVDRIEMDEAVGREKLNKWMMEHHGEDMKVIIDGPTF